MQEYFLKYVGYSNRLLCSQFGSVIISAKYVVSLTQEISDGRARDGRPPD